MGKLFLEFLKLGLFTIGGGVAMIPQMEQFAVRDNKWLTEEEVVDCIAVSQSLPGIIAINMATFIGRKLYGVRGAVCASVAVALPSFVIILAVAAFLGTLGEHPWLAGAFTGVKAAICGLILVSAFRMGKKLLKSPFAWILTAASLAAIAFAGINAVWVILGAALLGILRTAVFGGRLPGEDEEHGGDNAPGKDAEQARTDESGKDSEHGGGKSSGEVGR